MAQQKNYWTFNNDTILATRNTWNPDNSGHQVLTFEAFPAPMEAPF